MPEASSREFQEIPLELLEVGEKNIRRRDITVDLDQLAYSMKTFGLQHPIVVQKKNGKFEIIIGQRRYYAAKQLEWETIKARVIKERLNEFDAKVISFSENVQRRDLSPRDKAEACSYLLKQLGSPLAVAAHLGITEQTVRKWLDYADVPEELKGLVDNKTITRPQASNLFQYVSDVDKAVRIAKRMKEIKAPKKHQERIMASVQESPDSSIDSIFRRAEQMQYEKEIRFVLPTKWASVIERASERLGIPANEIARDATIEWLQMLRY